MKKNIIFLSILFFSLLFLNIKIIKNKGYENRFDNLKKINQNYNPDNFFLGQARMKNPKTNLNDFNTEDFYLIIIGDSHGGDLFNALNLNRDLFKGISFFYVQDFSYEGLLKNEKLLKNADMIIISYRWDDRKLKLLKNNFEKIKNLNEKIVISSRTNEYKVPSKLYTLLDYKVLFEKNDFDYFGLKKFYFENRAIHSKSDINKKLKKFTLEKKIKYLNKEDYMCEIIKKKCDYVDEVGYKIFYDYGHYTEHGARYFGKKIYETNWLKIN